MGAKTSTEMLKARALIVKGKSVPEAAKAAGITKQAIYMSSWYKARKNAASKPTR